MLLVAGLVAGQGEGLEGTSPKELGDSVSELLRRGDEAWSRRAEGQDDGVARREPVATAVALYRRAADAGESLPASIDYLRAAYFLGKHTDLPEKERRELYDATWSEVQRMLRRLHGTDDFERPPEELAEEVRDVPGAASAHYWAAIHWGLWGEVKSAMAALRQGVAKQVKLHSEVSSLVDPSCESGGGFRVLGRLHTVAPKVPLVTGWVDRDEAVRLLQKAYEADPTDFHNRLYLADAWHQFVPARKQQARAMLEALVGESPRDDLLVEDSQLLRQARALLADWNGS